MKQPDRFDKMVEAQRLGFSLKGTAILRCDDAVKLLRRQHAAYVRLVEKMPCNYADANGFCGVNKGGCSLNRGNLLAAFARYKEGTRS